MKEKIKNIVRKLLDEGVQIGSKSLILDAVRSYSKVDQKIIKKYLENNSVRKLQIGSGGNLHEGWLNTNYISRSEEFLQLDASEKFPFDDDQFDYIYSEHMIEHITYPQGQSMIAECFRTLRSRGKLRISTPDLAFLVELYDINKTQLQKDFIKHSTDRWIDYVPKYEDTFVINNYVRAWGHHFIYDEKVLSDLYKREGFVDVTRCEVCESADENLRNLENISRKPDGMIALESFVLEGTKP